VKTVEDVWMIKSGEYFETFGKRTDAMMQLADTSFLEQFPENTVFTLQPAYVVVDYRPPKHKNKPKRPKLIGKS
jgi:hypothetical protein